MKKLIPFIVLLITVILFKQNIEAQTIIQLEKKGGTYVIPNVKVNGIPMRMIYDTGASDVSLSTTEAKQMIKHGQLKAEDFIGIEQFQIANGDIVEGIKVILKEIEIGGIKIKGVEASIVANEAPVLFGQSALEKLGITQFDPNNATLTILNTSKSEYIYSDYYPSSSKVSYAIFKNTSYDCKKRPSSETLSGVDMVVVKENSFLWEICEIKDGKLLTALTRGNQVKLISRRFDWWKVNCNGLIGWVPEFVLELPICMLWLANVDK